MKLHTSISLKITPAGSGTTNNALCNGSLHLPRLVDTRKVQVEHVVKLLLTGEVRIVVSVPHHLPVKTGINFEWKLDFELESQSLKVKSFTKSINGFVKGGSLGVVLIDPPSTSRLEMMRRKKKVRKKDAN